jgi:hypothetical protein
VKESEIVDAVFQPEKSIRGEPVERCKLRYFHSFEFFDHSVLQKHTEKEFNHELSNRVNKLRDR